MESIGNQFLKLAEEGKKLLRQKGKKVSKPAPEVEEWAVKCLRIIEARYGRRSDKRKTFFRCWNIEVIDIENMIDILKLFGAEESFGQGLEHGTQVVVNVNQTQITEIQNRLSLQVLLNIISVA